MKELYNKKWMVIVSACLLLLSPINAFVKADYYEDYNVRPNFPMNQRDDQKSYFDLLMKPGTVQTISMDISNYGSNKMVAVVEVYNGSTADNASKQYMDLVDDDESLKYPLTDIVNIKDARFELNPGQTKTIQMNIEMPQEDIEGIILGGVRVYSDTPKENKQDNQKLQINNRMNYLIAVQLRTNENEVGKNLNLVSYGAKVTDQRSSFFANIQNDKAVSMSNVNVTGEIYEADTDKVVATVSVLNGGINPNTNFNVIYSLNGEKLVAGKYDMKLKIEDETDMWEWNETFEVTSQQANEVNSGAHLNNKKGILPYIIIALLSVIIILLLILLFYRRKKDEEQNPQQ